jgi:quinol monooxygenase YgiN
MSPHTGIYRRNHSKRVIASFSRAGDLLCSPVQTRLLPVFLAGILLFGGFPHVAMAQGAAGRLHVVAHVDVIPKFSEDTSKALMAYAVDSRRDAGAVRVDVLVEAGRPNHFTVIELWESHAAYDAHVSKDHTRAFREKLHPWLGSPYDERLNEEVKP